MLFMEKKWSMIFLEQKMMKLSTSIKNANCVVFQTKKNQTYHLIGNRKCNRFYVAFFDREPSGNEKIDNWRKVGNTISCNKEAYFRTFSDTEFVVLYFSKDGKSAAECGISIFEVEGSNDSKDLSDGKEIFLNKEGDVLNLCWEGNPAVRTLTVCCNNKPQMEVFVYDLNERFPLTLTCKLECDGVYYAEALDHFEKILASSVPVTYFSNQYKERYKSFVEKLNPEKGSLKYFPSKEPYYDFVCTKDTDKLDTVGLHLNYCKQLGGICVYTSRLFEDTFLSGVVFDEDNLILGQDIDASYTKLSEKMGYFTFLSLENEKLVIGNDFFGLGKLFYYATGDRFIISNRYHLLLLTMKRLNEKIELDYEIILASFFSPPAFCQDFLSSRLYVKETFCLEVGKQIEIYSDEIKYVINQDIYRKGNDDISDAEYRKLIQKGGDEIIRNVRSIVNNQKYEKKILDLTGGLDSRVVFAALTNLDNAQKKVGLYTNPSSGEGDIEVACALAKAYGYVFDGDFYDLEKIKKNHMDYSFQEQIEMELSYHLGTWFETDSLWVPIKKNNEYIRMTGGTEVFKPYYTKMYSFFDWNQMSSEAIIHNMIMVDAKWNYFDYEKIGKKFEEIGVNSVENCPGVSPKQKFENMYLMYRNRSHFDYSLRSSESIITVCPFMSKILWGLLYDTYLYKQKNIQYDLTNYLNSIVGAFEYEKDDYNIERAQIIDELAFIEPQNKNLLLGKSEKIDKWSHEIEQVNNEKQFEGDDSAYDSWKVAQEIGFDKCLYDIVLKHFVNVMQYDNHFFEENVGIPMFLWLEKFDVSSSRKRNRLKIWFGKLASVSYLINLINE